MKPKDFIAKMKPAELLKASNPFVNRIGGFTRDIVKRNENPVTPIEVLVEDEDTGFVQRTSKWLRPHLFD